MGQEPILDLSPEFQRHPLFNQCCPGSPCLRCGWGCHPVGFASHVPPWVGFGPPPLPFRSEAVLALSLWTGLCFSLGAPIHRVGPAPTPGRRETASGCAGRPSGEGLFLERSLPRPELERTLYPERRTGPEAAPSRRPAPVGQWPEGRGQRGEKGGSRHGPRSGLEALPPRAPGLLRGARAPAERPRRGGGGAGRGGISSLAEGGPCSEAGPRTAGGGAGSSREPSRARGPSLYGHSEPLSARRARSRRRPHLAPPGSLSRPAPRALRLLP